MRARIVLRRIFPLAVGGLCLAFAAGFDWAAISLLIDPRAFIVTAALPWLGLALAESTGTALGAAADWLHRDPRSLPASRRRATAARLAELGSMSLAAGVVAAGLTLLGAFEALARGGGQADRNAWIGLSAGLLLGPIYGLLLKALLYDVAATALVAEGSELGLELEQD